MNKHAMGFTLVELLVGILIFSIIMLALFSTFNAFVFSSKAVAQDISRTESIKNALLRMILDLESIFIMQSPRYIKPEFNTDPDPYRLLGQLDNTGTGAILMFSSLSSIGAKNQLSRLGYFVREDQTGQLNIYRSASLHLQQKYGQECDVPILCPNIKGFEISFFDGEANEFKEWDSDSKETGFAFPKRIVLKILYDHNGRTQIMQTGINLPMARQAMK